MADEEKNIVPQETGNIDTGAEELADILDRGPASGRRSGALKFFAIIVVLGAALHFYMAENNTGTFIAHLDSELLRQASLSISTQAEGNGRLAVVPSWPYRLYANLRRDIAWYSAAAVVAAFLWGLAVQARARRDSFLVCKKTADEVEALRKRIEELEKNSGQHKCGTEGMTKG